MEQHGTSFLDKLDQGLTFLKFRSVLWLIGQVSRHGSCKQLGEVVVLLTGVHRADGWLELHQYRVSAHSDGIRACLKISSLSGLGLLEYLYWCEDLNMQPIMAVWAGEWYCWNEYCSIFISRLFSLEGKCPGKRAGTLYSTSHWSSRFSFWSVAPCSNSYEFILGELRGWRPC